MGRVCEKIVSSFSKLLFGKSQNVKERQERKDEYVLSSVFPTPQVMRDVKKVL